METPNPDETISLPVTFKPREYLAIITGGCELELRGPFRWTPHERATQMRAALKKEMRENGQLLATEGRDTAIFLTLKARHGDIELIPGTFSGDYLDNVRDEVEEELRAARVRLASKAPKEHTADTKEEA